MATVDDLQFEGTSFECPPFMVSLSVVRAMDFGWYTGTCIKEDYFRHFHKRMPQQVIPFVRINGSFLPNSPLDWEHHKFSADYRNCL